VDSAPHPRKWRKTFCLDTLASWVWWPAFTTRLQRFSKILRFTSIHPRQRQGRGCTALGATMRESQTETRSSRASPYCQPLASARAISEYRVTCTRGRRFKSCLPDQFKSRFCLVFGYGNTRSDRERAIASVLEEVPRTARHVSSMRLSLTDRRRGAVHVGRARRPPGRAGVSRSREHRRFACRDARGWLRPPSAAAGCAPLPC